MNNYYEILEVSKNASKEVIEKAYKVLTKKYHPDLQEQSNKQTAEEKMKLINEAYEVLSDDTKRKEYDIELQNQLEIERKIEYERIKEESIKTQNNNENNIYNNNSEEQVLTKEQIKEQLKQEKIARRQYQEEQEKIYAHYMRSLGYKVKERWTMKKIIKLLEAIGIFLIVILIIWFFPPTHKLLLQTYEENKIVKTIIDIIIDIIQGFAKGIGTFFMTIYK